MLGGSTDHLLCENLLSFPPAAIFFCQPVTISLIANTTEDCRPALVQHCCFEAHASLPTVRGYFNESVFDFFLLFSMRLDSSEPDCSTLVNGDPTPWHDLSGGWVTCQGKARCTESAETVDKSLPPAWQKKRSLSPTTHEGEGRKHPQSGWCMVWTLVWDLGFNGEKGRKWKGGGGSCLNYADVGRNRSEKPTKAMAASMELAATNNKVIITRA